MTATTLASGAVLVAGGSGGPFGDSVALAELYDPQTGAFAPTGPMTSPRWYHAATLLDADTVLIAGGQNRDGGADLTAELWKASTGTFTSTGWMTTRRPFPAAATVGDGRALVYGASIADLFDSATGTFSAIPAPSSAYGPVTATALSDHEVLLALKTAGLFDPALGAVVPTTSGLIGHDGGRAALLPNDRVLIVGGYTTFAEVWHKPLTGEACGSDSECKDGLCGRGFCCATPCATCSRCLEGTGECAPLLYGEDPHSCSFPKLCDGNGECKLWRGQACGTDSASCASAHCVDSVCCETDCNGGDPDDNLACSKQAGGVSDGYCTWKLGGPCDDNNACTTADTFSHAGCRGTMVVCAQEAECNQTYCNVYSGQCDAYVPAADGTPCSLGVCAAGVCGPSAQGGAGGEAGNGANGGLGGNANGGTASGGDGGAPGAGQTQGGGGASDDLAGDAGAPSRAGASGAGDGPPGGIGGERSGAGGGVGGLTSDSGDGPVGGSRDEGGTGGVHEDGSRPPRLSRGCGCTVVGSGAEHGWLVAVLCLLRLRRRAFHPHSTRHRKG